VPEETVVNLIVERAQQVAADVANARSRRAFLASLRHFERMLALAPDYPRGSFSQGDSEVLAALAETVVSHVESRLDRRTDRPAVQQTLVATVYRIRADVEALYTFVAGHQDSAPAR
jgi:hypothetical protein